MDKIIVKINSILLGIAFCISLSGCTIGNEASESLDIETSDSDSFDVAVSESNDITIDAISSEEDFRIAISETTGLEDKIALYDRFSSQYTLSETEYIDYADTCASLGDTKKQRDILWTLYRLDPSKEHGELISDRCMYLDESDIDAIKLVEALKERLDKIGGDDFDIASIVTLVNGDSWGTNFFLDSGIYTSHAGYFGDGYEAHIRSGRVSTDIIITEADRELSVFTDSFGSVVKVCKLNDEAYEGDFAIVDYDTEGESISKKVGTIKDGHCIGTLTLVIEGVAFSGQFDDNGITTEAQQDKVEGVVYAYNDSKNKYLFIENADPESWTASEEFIGLK